MRARLLARGAPDEHVLVLCVHHIATDGWSTGVAGRDLSAAYAARLEGRAPGWAPLPVQYADYAVWQRELLGDEDDPGSVLAAQVAYWRDALAGAPPELELPADRPRPAVPSHRGHAVPLEVPAEVARRAGGAGPGAGRDAVHGAAGGAGGAAVHGSAAGTTSRSAPGSPGRTDEALDDLIGFFVNTLVLRTDLSGDPSFTELLGRVRGGSGWAALAHQDVPFERLVDDLAPDRSLARHPLFQVLLTMQNNAAPDPVACPACGRRAVRGRDRGGPVRPERAAGRGPTTAEGRPGGLRGRLLAAADLFDAGTAAAVAARFGRVLAAVAADPAGRLRQVEVLDAAERAQLVAGWNDTAAEVPAASVAGAGRGAGGGDAGCGGGVRAGTGAVTYGELMARAGRLGGYLRAAGAGPETVVGLCLDRGPEMVTAMLAVWLAGAAYLPLDPAWPAARLAFMLADAPGGAGGRDRRGGAGEPAGGPGAGDRAG